MLRASCFHQCNATASISALGVAAGRCNLRWRTLVHNIALGRVTVWR